MKDLFQELAWKCRENGLYFEYMPNEEEIFITNETDFNTGECLADYPMDALRDLINAVDEYEESAETNDEEFITERPHGVSMDEMEMKRAGHTIKDFM